VRFNGICLITRDVRKLAHFYKEVLQAEAEGDETTARIYVEGGAVLDLCAWEGVEGLAPGSMKGAGYGGISIDMETADVDAEYERLKDRVAIAKLPETYPWGRRSFWFRDPDGNLLNFYETVGNRRS